MSYARYAIFGLDRGGDYLFALRPSLREARRVARDESRTNTAHAAWILRGERIAAFYRNGKETPK